MLTTSSISIWRHWDCVTPKVISNLKKTFEAASELDGFDDLRPEDQARVTEAYQNGRVANTSSSMVPRQMNEMLPEYIKSSFLRINPEADGARYYRPWNSVLNYAFPIKDGYEIAPQFPLSSVGKDTIDSPVILTVFRNEASIFFVEVKAPKYLGQIYARTAADDQIRKRFTQLHHSSPSKLQGVSAFGTSLCFYELDKNTGKITPEPTEEYSRSYVKDLAPKDWWNLDLLDQVGYDTFLVAVEAAKTIVHGM